MDGNQTQRFENITSPKLQQAIDGVWSWANNITRQMNPPTNWITMAATLSTMGQGDEYVLARSFILDSGSDTHICNDQNRFTSYWEAPIGEELRIGDTCTEIEGYGTVPVYPEGINRSSWELVLQNVAYVAGFHTNIVSADQAEDADVHWNRRLHCLELNDSTPICTIPRQFGQSVLEYGIMASLARWSHADAANQAPGNKHNGSEITKISLVRWTTRTPWINKFIIARPGTVILLHLRAQSRKFPSRHLAAGIQRRSSFRVLNNFN